MFAGTVKWFDKKKGYGFITGSNGPDVFVHYSCIEGDGFKTLCEGDIVEFDIADGEKGTKAKSVILKTPSVK
jgi:cold shock protein